MREDRQKKPVALPLAMADVAVHIIHHAPVRGCEAIPPRQPLRGRDGGGQWRSLDLRRGLFPGHEAGGERREDRNSRQSRCTDEL